MSIFIWPSNFAEFSSLRQERCLCHFVPMKLVSLPVFLRAARTSSLESEVFTSTRCPSMSMSTFSTSAQQDKNRINNKNYCSFTCQCCVVGSFNVVPIFNFYSKLRIHAARLAQMEFNPETENVCTYNLESTLNS